MRAGTAYKLGTYLFVVARENQRVHNMNVIEHKTLSTSFILENTETLSRRHFVIVENTQDTQDLEILQLMAEVPQTYSLVTERGTFTVVVNDISFEERFNDYEITLTLIEVSELRPLRVVVETPTTNLTDNTISAVIQPTTIDRAGTLTLNLENVDSDQSYLATEADTISVYVGQNMELQPLGDYYVDKIYYSMTTSGWTIRVEGRTLSAQLLADTQYTSDETWETTTTIYDLVTANDSYSIAYSTTLSTAGVNTDLSSMYLSSQRIVKAGTTKMQALSDLLDYIYTDLGEEWVGYTSDTGNILYVQPASTGDVPEHSFVYGTNILKATIQQGHGTKNWVQALGSTLDTTYSDTSFTDKKTDANYTYYHNCACIPTYEKVFVVISDTGEPQGIISSYDFTDGYKEIYYDTTNTIYRCCFAYSTSRLLIGTDSKILTFVIPGSDVFEVVQDQSMYNQIGTYVGMAINSADNVMIAYAPYDRLSGSDTAMTASEAYRNGENSWTIKNFVGAQTGVNLYITPAGKVVMCVYQGGGFYFVKKDSFSNDWVYELVETDLLSGGYGGYAVSDDTKHWMLYEQGKLVSYAGHSYYASYVYTRYYNGSSWTETEIDVLGFIPFYSMDFRPTTLYNEPQMVYVDQSRNIEYRKWNASTEQWRSTETVVATSLIGSEPFIYVDFGNEPHVVYYTTDYKYYHAYKSAGVWTTEVIDTLGAPASGAGTAFIRMVQDSTGQLIVVYHDLQNKQLKGAIKVSGSWQKVILYDEQSVTTGEVTFVASKHAAGVKIDSDDVVHIAFYQWPYSDWPNGAILYFQWDPQTVSEIETGLDAIVAFAQLGTNYYALTTTAKLLKTSTPLRAGSWSEIKDFGTVGYDIISDDTNLYVAYDDQLEYASTITTDTSWTTLKDNGGTDFQCLGKACNVIYAGDQNGNLYSFTDTTYTKTETDSDHEMSTNTIYAITDVMGDVFCSHGSNGQIQRLFLTYNGDDTDWREDADLDNVAIQEIQGFDQDGIIVPLAGHLYVAHVKTPSEIERVRKIARDLTDINTNGKKADYYVNADVASPVTLCAQAQNELSKRIESQLNYDLTIPGDHTLSMNDPCSVYLEGFSGSMEIRSIQHTISISGWLTDVELGGTFPNLAAIIDDWSRGGSGGTQSGGGGGYERHDLLSNLAWSVAGHTIDSNLDLNSHNILEGGSITCTSVDTGVINHSTAITITGAGVIQIQGDNSPSYPASSAGLEITYDSDGQIGSGSGGSGVSILQSYSRAATAWRDLWLRGNDVQIDAAGSAALILTGGHVCIEDTSTYVEKDGSSNLSFTDAVSGTKTLAQLIATLGMITYRSADAAAWDYTQATLTQDNDWHDLDLSGIIDSGATGVVIELSIKDANTGTAIYFRKNGNSNSVEGPRDSILVANLYQNAFFFVECDSSGVIEYKCSAAFDVINIYIYGWTGGEFDFTSSGPLNFMPDSDTDDYIQFTTSGNVPQINTQGSCNLEISPSAILALEPTTGITANKYLDITITNTNTGDDALKVLITNDSTAITGTLRAGYFVATNGTLNGSGTIRGIEAKARAAQSDLTGSNITTLEAISASADAKDKTVTTLRGAELILDGQAGASVTTAVGLRIAQNFQADIATTTYGLQFYYDSFENDADIILSSGGTIGGASGDMTINSDGEVVVAGEIIEVNTTADRAYLRLRADGGGVNQDDFCDINMRNDQSDVIITVYDTSASTYYPMLEFDYLSERLRLRDNTISEIKRYSQNAEPALANNQDMAIWHDLDDAKVYLLYKDPTLGQKKVELI